MPMSQKRYVLAAIHVLNVVSDHKYTSKLSINF